MKQRIIEGILWLTAMTLTGLLTYMTLSESVHAAPPPIRVFPPPHKPTPPITTVPIAQARAAYTAIQARADGLMEDASLLSEAGMAEEARDAEQQAYAMTEALRLMVQAMPALVAPPKPPRSYPPVPKPPVIKLPALTER